MLIIGLFGDWAIFDVNNFDNLVVAMTMLYIHTMKSTTAHAV
jgi:hypothetical protein